MGSLIKHSEVETLVPPKVQDCKQISDFQIV